MDQRHSKICALIVAIAAGFSTMPLLQPNFFATWDGLLHVYRLMEYDILLKSGIWYPRWAPDFFFGSGLPLFNFYAPATYYLAEIFRLVGVGYLDSTRIFVAAMMALSGIGAYLYARSWFSPLASTVVAVVYMYAPYHLVNLYYRGDIAEYAAFTWLPFILWATTRLIQHKSMGYLLAGAFFYCALILTHNLSAYIFSGFLLVYCLAALLGQHLPRQFNWREILADALRLLAMASTALALSMFFWLPAIFEKPFVNFARLLAIIDFHNHFPTLEELLSADLIHRYAFVFGSAEVYGYRLGVFQAGFLIVGFALLAWQRRRLGLGPALEGMASITVTGICLFLVFPISMGAWEIIPMLDLAQFPWRFLAFMALPSAFLAGLIVQSLPVHIRSVAVVVIVPAVIASSVAAMFPFMSNVTEAQITPKGSIAFELMSGTIGTTAAAESLPLWVKENLATPFAAATILDESVTNPSGRSDSGIDIAQVENKGDRSTYRVHAARAGSLVPNLVYFPGWIAFVDDREVPTSIDDPSGFIRVAVPAGEHVVSFRFQDTPVRSLSNAVSLATLLVLIGMLLWRYGREVCSLVRKLRPNSQRRKLLPDGIADQRDRQSLLRFLHQSTTGERLAKAAIIVALVPIWLASKSAYDSVYAMAATYGLPLIANFDGEIMTASYVISGPDSESGSPAQIIPGSSIRFTIFWRKLSNDFRNQYRPFIRLTNMYGQTWAYEGTSTEGPEATEAPEDILANTFALTIPEGTPPGITYEIEVGFKKTTIERPMKVQRVWVPPLLPFNSGVRMGPLVVSRNLSSYAQPGTKLGSPAHPNLANPVTFGDTLRLLDLSVADGEALKSGRPGLTLARDTGSNSWQSRAGEVIHVDFLWQALREMTDDYTVSARLIGTDRNLWAIRDSQPADGMYPTSLWAKGEVVRDQLDVTVPPETPPGQYELQLEAVSPKGPLSVIGGNGAAIGPTLHIGNLSILPATSPARPGDVKVSQHKVMPMLDYLDIVGYELSRREIKPGQQLDVDLVWRATTAIVKDMVVRIEMVTPGGDTLATVTRR
ncbi:MAG: 6-pyruvoyl-tetrahydropterin synthase-related protein, partial [Dehalococcoidia bacterium]|nr:6-pyruvoyl-tetrahydropterin synthase-related protein [Dehalococcoidia bacterium]